MLLTLNESKGTVWKAALDLMECNKQLSAGDSSIMLSFTSFLATFTSVSGCLGSKQHRQLLLFHYAKYNRPVQSCIQGLLGSHLRIWLTILGKLLRYSFNIWKIILYNKKYIIYANIF